MGNVKLYLHHIAHIRSALFPLLPMLLTPAQLGGENL